jgi:uncharacterized protein YndB with AHSA1/START domain
MITVDVRIVIARPVAEVYAYLTDLRNEPQWWRGVRKAERLAGDGGAGTRYWLTARLLGLPASTEIEVTEADPPRLFTIVAKAWPPYQCRYLFEPVPAGTMVRLVADLRIPFGKAILTRLMYYNLRRLDRVVTA